MKSSAKRTLSHVRTMLMLKLISQPNSQLGCINWVAVKELNLSYYIGETLLFTVYTQYGNLI